MKKVIALLIGLLAVTVAVGMAISVKADPTDGDGDNKKIIYRVYQTRDKQTIESQDAEVVRKLITSGQAVYAGVSLYQGNRQLVTTMKDQPSARQASASTSLKSGWTNQELSAFVRLELALSTKDSELRATQELYNADNYDVTYHFENGTQTKTVIYHGENPVTLPQPVKKGWFLRGWSKKPNTKTVDFKGGQVVKGLAPGESRLDLYAVYYQPTDFDFVVDTSAFKVIVKDKESGKVWKTFDCTIGEPGNDTPLGQFEIQRKYLYDYMPLAEQDVWYTSYFTSTGVAFHAAPWRYYYGEWHLGQRASHGCINMRTEDAQWIYEHCKIGDSVTVK
jgi:lipoprotein-anchoring transpeptidase ErfK/SrfK